MSLVVLLVDPLEAPPSPELDQVLGEFAERHAIFESEPELSAAPAEIFTNQERNRAVAVFIDRPERHGYI